MLFFRVFLNIFDPGGVIGTQTAGNALVFRDLLNAEGIRSKALTVCSGAWGGYQYLDCIQSAKKPFECFGFSFV